MAPASFDVEMRFLACSAPPESSFKTRSPKSYAITLLLPPAQLSFQQPQKINYNHDSLTGKDKRLLISW
jgi:hypothetical protein